MWNPEDRLTASEILEHDFFKEGKPSKRDRRSEESSDIEDVVSEEGSGSEERSDNEESNSEEDGSDLD